MNAKASQASAEADFNLVRVWLVLGLIQQSEKFQPGCVDFLCFLLPLWFFYYSYESG